MTWIRVGIDCCLILQELLDFVTRYMSKKVVKPCPLLHISNKIVCYDMPIAVTDQP